MTEREERRELRAEEEREREGREGPDEAALEKLLAQPLAIGDFLRAGAEAELAQREGEWSAFEVAVFRRIDEGERAAVRMSVEERAIARMKSEVESEVAELAPRFDAAFRQGVEEKIWRAAKARPSLGERFGAWLEEVRAGFFASRRGMGFAAAAAAVVLAVAIGGIPMLGGGDELIGEGMNPVSVDHVSFEGTVTVMQENGMAVLWLADDNDALR